MDVLERIGDGLWNAFQMAWEVGWALVLGFALSGVVQAWIPRSRMESALGGRDLRTAGARHRARRRFLVLQLRRGRDREVDVPEGSEPGDRDGVPVRLDEPRVRDRDRDVDLPRLGVHARRVRRRPVPDRLHVGGDPLLRHAAARRGGARARTPRADRPRAPHGRLRGAQLARAAHLAQGVVGRRAQLPRRRRRCSGRRSPRGS